MRPTPRPRGPKAQRGLSLVELLVAMALGAFITVGIIQMFTANQETYRVNIGQARMQESARFALEFLTAPIRMAGFTGCYSEDDIFEAVAQVAGSPPYEANFAAGAIAGHEATAPGVWSPGLGLLPADVQALAPIDGTDVLAVRTSDPSGARLAVPMATPSAPVVIRNPLVASAYATGALLVISDCQKGAIFQSTGSTVAASTTSILHAAGAAGVTPGNAVQALTVDGSSFDVDATVHAVATKIYFIANGVGLNNRGDPPRSLWRKTGGAPPVELVEGIEDLQVLYGVDSDGDGVPNRYLTFQNIADLSTVLTMRISLTANSVDVVTGAGDGLIRRTFTNTVALRNRIN